MATPAVDNYRAIMNPASHSTGNDHSLDNTAAALPILGNVQATTMTSGQHVNSNNNNNTETKSSTLSDATLVSLDIQQITEIEVVELINKLHVSNINSTVIPTSVYSPPCVYCPQNASGNNDNIILVGEGSDTDKPDLSNDSQWKEFEVSNFQVDTYKNANNTLSIYLHDSSSNLLFPNDYVLLKALLLRELTETLSTNEQRALDVYRHHYPFVAEQLLQQLIAPVENIFKPNQSAAPYILSPEDQKEQDAFNNDPEVLIFGRDETGHRADFAPRDREEILYWVQHEPPIRQRSQSVDSMIRGFASKEAAIAEAAAAASRPVKPATPEPAPEIQAAPSPVISPLAAGATTPILPEGHKKSISRVEHYLKKQRTEVITSIPRSFSSPNLLGPHRQVLAHQGGLPLFQQTVGQTHSRTRASFGISGGFGTGVGSDHHESLESIDHTHPPRTTAAEQDKFAEYRRRISPCVPRLAPQKEPAPRANGYANLVWQEQEGLHIFPASPTTRGRGQDSHPAFQFSPQQTGFASALNALALNESTQPRRRPQSALSLARHPTDRITGLKRHISTSTINTVCGGNGISILHMDNGDITDMTSHLTKLNLHDYNIHNIQQDNQKDEVQPELDEEQVNNADTNNKQVQNTCEISITSYVDTDNYISDSSDSSYILRSLPTLDHDHDYSHIHNLSSHEWNLACNQHVHNDGVNNEINMDLFYQLQYYNYLQSQGGSTSGSESEYAPPSNETSDDNSTICSGPDSLADQLQYIEEVHQGIHQGGSSAPIIGAAAGTGNPSSPTGMSATSLPHSPFTVGHASAFDSLDLPPISEDPNRVYRHDGTKWILMARHEALLLDIKDSERQRQASPPLPHNYVLVRAPYLHDLLQRVPLQQGSGQPTASAIPTALPSLSHPNHVGSVSRMDSDSTVSPLANDNASVHMSRHIGASASSRNAGAVSGFVHQPAAVPFQFARFAEAYSTQDVISSDLQNIEQEHPVIKAAKASAVQGINDQWAQPPEKVFDTSSFGSKLPVQILEDLNQGPIGVISLQDLVDAAEQARKQMSNFTKTTVNDEGRAVTVPVECVSDGRQLNYHGFHTETLGGFMGHASRTLLTKTMKNMATMHPQKKEVFNQVASNLADVDRTDWKDASVALLAQDSRYAKFIKNKYIHPKRVTCHAKKKNGDNLTFKKHGVAVACHPVLMAVNKDETQRPHFNDNYLSKHQLARRDRQGINETGSFALVATIDFVFHIWFQNTTLGDKRIDSPLSTAAEPVGFMATPIFAIPKSMSAFHALVDRTADTVLARVNVTLFSISEEYKVKHNQYREPKKKELLSLAADCGKFISGELTDIPARHKVVQRCEELYRKDKILARTQANQNERKNRQSKSGKTVKGNMIDSESEDESSIDSYSISLSNLSDIPIHSSPEVTAQQASGMPTAGSVNASGLALAQPETVDGFPLVTTPNQSDAEDSANETSDSDESDEHASDIDTNDLDAEDLESDADDQDLGKNHIPNINLLLKTFNYSIIQQRASPNDICLLCSTTYNSTTSHLLPTTCSTCNGNTYLCSPIHTGLDCFLNQVLSKSLETMTPSERFSLLSEYQTNHGVWRCVYCNIDCTRAWQDQRPHGLVESTLGLYIPGCLTYGSIACRLAHDTVFHPVNLASKHSSLPHDISSQHFIPPTQSTTVSHTQPSFANNKTPSYTNPGSTPHITSFSFPLSSMHNTSNFLYRGEGDKKRSDITDVIDHFNINPSGNHCRVRKERVASNNIHSKNTIPKETLGTIPDNNKQQRILSDITNLWYPVGTAQHRNTNKLQRQETVQISQKYIDELRKQEFVRLYQSDKENIPVLNNLVHNPSKIKLAERDITENHSYSSHTHYVPEMHYGLGETEQEKHGFNYVLNNTKGLPSKNGRQIGHNRPIGIHTYSTNQHRQEYMDTVGRDTQQNRYMKLPLDKETQISRQYTQNPKIPSVNTTTEPSTPSVQTIEQQGLSPGIYSVGSDNTVTFTPPIPTGANKPIIPLSLLQTLSQTQQQAAVEQQNAVNPIMQQNAINPHMEKVVVKQESEYSKTTDKSVTIPPIKLEKQSTSLKDSGNDPSDSSDTESSSSSSSSSDSEKNKKNHRKEKTKKGYRKKKGKKSSKYYSSSSDSEDKSSSSSEEERVSKSQNTLFSLLQDMTCDSEYANELALLKTLFTRRSELPELKHNNKYYTPKLTDYFPEIYKGNAKRLKRYLIRLLEYSATKANSHRERADLVSEGPGLSDECIKDLEMATKIPLPGLGDTYGEDKLSQKQRLLDLLLTFVILFYKDEPISALHDLKLRGPFLSGLTRLYQTITSGNTQLPPKLIEEYLARAILRSDNGDGMALLGTFQGQLRLQKQLDSSYTKDENKHRRLIYNCCATLTNEYLTLNSSSGQIRDQNTRSQQQRPTREQYPQSPQPQYRQQSSQPIPQQFRELYPRQPQPQYREPYPRGQQTQHRQQYQQQQYSQRPRYENTNMTDVFEQDDLVTEYTNMVVDERNNNTPHTESARTKQEKIESFQRLFMTKPCRCCGSPFHPMLRNEKGPDGRPYTEYQCPVSMCEKWADARQSMVKNLKYQINPEKFAQMCKLDSYKVMEAWKHFIENGAGKFKKNPELSTLRSSILSFCKPSSGVRPQEHRSSSLSLRIKQRDESDLEECYNHYTTPSTTIAIHSGDPYARGTNLCGTLHLLVATKVEPATKEEIENLHCDKPNNLESLYSTEYRSIDDHNALRVRLMLPTGESFVVPYREVQGKILPDTGSTTSLINEDFARSKGLHIEESPYEIILKDVNNGERAIQHRCYLRLTITTITGREVVTVLPALCVKDLSHEILLGTKDLERYQVSVIPHLGQAKMTIGYEEMIFPMMDAISIWELQNNLQTLNETRSRC